MSYSHPLIDDKLYYLLLILQYHLHIAAYDKEKGKYNI